MHKIYLLNSFLALFLFNGCNRIIIPFGSDGWITLEEGSRYDPDRFRNDAFCQSK